jgi:hypothetical protein
MDGNEATFHYGYDIYRPFHEFLAKAAGVRFGRVMLAPNNAKQIIAIVIWLSRIEQDVFVQTILSRIGTDNFLAAPYYVNKGCTVSEATLFQIPSPHTPIRQAFKFESL